MTLQCGSVSQAKSPTARTEGLSAFLQEGRRCNLANLRQSIRKKPWAGCGGMPFRHFGKDEAEVLDLHCVDPLTFQMNDPANWKSSNPFFHRAQSTDERIGTQQILTSCRGRSYGTGLAAPEDRNPAYWHGRMFPTQTSGSAVEAPLKTPSAEQRIFGCRFRA